MSTAARTRMYSFEDFCAIVQDGQKADLIDGVIYMASPDNTDANELNVWLASLMFAFAQRRKAGKVYVSRVAFRLDEWSGPEPDIALVLKEHLERVRRGHVKGPPDIAMEIVSPDSIDRDYHKKRRQYERAGVPEYWIIDEIEKKVLLLRLDAHGKYREVRLTRGIMRSRVLKGFWLDTKWLWQTPLPDVISTLKKIVSKRDAR